MPPGSRGRGSAGPDRTLDSAWQNVAPPARYLRRRGGGFPRGRLTAPLVKRNEWRRRGEPEQARRQGPPPRPHPSDVPLSPERKNGSGPGEGGGGRADAGCLPGARGSDSRLGSWARGAESPPCRGWAGGQGHSGPSRSVTRACLCNSPDFSPAPPSLWTGPSRGAVPPAATSGAEEW